MQLIFIADNLENNSHEFFYFLSLSLLSSFSQSVLKLIKML